MGFEFLLTSLIGVIAPGPGAIFTLAAGLSRGARLGVVAAFGCTLGILPHMAAAITGLAAVLHASALAFDILRYFGVAYLLYLAWQAWRAEGMLRLEGAGVSTEPTRIIRSAVLLNLLNPKLSIFFFAFLPQFPAAEGQSALLHMVGQSAVFMMMTFAVFASYGACAAAVRARVLSSPLIPGWMRKGFALAFLALGLRLGLAER